MQCLRLVVATAALTLSACGKDDSGRKTGAGSALVPRRTADLSAKTGCAPAARLALGDDSALRHIPAESLRIVQGNTVRAMCDVLKDKPRTVAVYQFTSVTCVPCMQWAQKLNADLVAKGFGESVLSVLVLTDPTGILTADDERRLQHDVAPDATWVYDDFQDLWSFFAPGDRAAAVPAVTPLAVVMDAAQRGFTSADASGDAVALIAKVNAVLELGIAAKPAP